MYQIHHTEAIVLGYKNTGDYDRVFTFLTKDYGIVYAKATGIRRESSKSRYVLSLFSYCDIDLVYGKNYWRVTQAKLIDPHDALPHNTFSIMVAARVSKLIRKLCMSDEPISNIFQEYQILLSEINNKYITKDNVASLEVLSVIKILTSLGYVNESSMLDIIKDGVSASDIDTQKKKTLVKYINNALKFSQM